MENEKVICAFNLLVYICVVSLIEMSEEFSKAYSSDDYISDSNDGYLWF